jgi:gluconokinase
MVIVLMGVSGSGKTTVGRRLAADLDWPFHDGDDFHPQANVEKMRRGEPLDDGDRAAWLDRLRALIGRILAEGDSAVLACSALKRRYRARLTVDPSKVVLVYLRGSYELIRRRMEERRGHFMPARLLRSQFEALEEPEEGAALVIDVDRSPEEIASEIERALDLLQATA